MATNKVLIKVFCEAKEREAIKKAAQREDRKKTTGRISMNTFMLLAARERMARKAEECK